MVRMIRLTSAGTQSMGGHDSHSGTKRSYSTFKVRRSGGEEIPIVQGKRNPSKMVGVVRGHQRADTLKP